MLPLLSVYICTLLVYSTYAKELYQSQKATLCPRVEAIRSKSYDKPSSAKTAKVHIAHDGRINRINTRRPLNPINGTYTSGDNGDGLTLDNTDVSLSRNVTVPSEDIVQQRLDSYRKASKFPRVLPKDGSSAVKSSSTMDTGLGVITPYALYPHYGPMTKSLHPMMRSLPYCSIVPQPNMFRVLSNILASFRLLLLDHGVGAQESPIVLFLMATLSSIPWFVLRFASTPSIMSMLRKRWAFQGECGCFTVEDMLRIALSVLTAESVMKLGLRAWFYGRNVNWVSMIPNGVYSVGGSISQKFAFLPRALNALGTGVFGGYWSGESLSGLIHFIVHSAVIARLAFITAIQHALFRENFHTASFILSPLASKLASVVTGIVCAIATAGNLGTMFIFKNFANAVDVEHLLDQSSFRATESQAAATGYVRNAIHNIPKLLKSANLDIVVQLTYYHDYLVRLVPRGIEWPILLFHLSLALYANSAAGLYLALVNAVYSVINQRLSSYERSIVTRDIDEIVQESG